MAISWGPWRTYGSLNAFRLGLDFESGNILRVYGEAQITHGWTTTLNRSGAWSGQTSVTFNSSNGTTTRRDLYAAVVSANGTYSVSLTVPWGGIGTATASRSITVTSEPAAPGAPTLTRTNDTDMTVSWSAAARATSYKVQRKAGDDGSWFTSKRGLTGLSHVMPNMSANERHYIRIVAVNSAGEATGPQAGPFYSKPAMPTDLVGTVLASTYSFTAKNNAKYPYGLEVQRDGGSTYTNGTGTSGNITTVSASLTYNASYRFRARAFAGPTTGIGRSYSDWTDYITPEVGPPTLAATTFRAVGATPNPVGTQIMVSATGSAPNVAGNTMTLRARAKKKTATTWGGWTTNKASVTAGSFSRVSFPLTMPVADILHVYDVQVELIDKWARTALVELELPTGEVSLSLSKTGAAVGKVWEEGGAKFQVGGDASVSGDMSVGGALTTLGVPVGKEPITFDVPGIALDSGGGTGYTLTVSAPTFHAGRSWNNYQPSYAVVGSDNNNTERFVTNIRKYGATGMSFSVKKIATGSVTAGEWYIAVTLTPKF